MVMRYKARVYSEVVAEGPNVGLRYWVVEFLDLARPQGVQTRRWSIHGRWRDALRTAITDAVDRPAHP